MPDIEWRETPLSSNVVRLGYQSDPPALIVDWRNSKKGMSEYAGVDGATFEEGLKAPSIGRWLNTAIKPKYSMRYI